MKYLQKLLAIFLILFSMMIILSGLFNYKENGGLVSVCLVIGGGFIVYLSSKTLVFNPKSMENLKGKIRKIELVMKYGDEGKVMALKEVYEKKNTKELLERYRLDYSKVRSDVKLIMIEELKKRELISKEEYEEKLNKINEEKKTENFSREEEELNKIKEEVKVENEEKLRQEKRLEEEKKRTLNKEKEYEEAREKLNNKTYKKNNYSNENEEISKLTSYFIGIFIGIVPIMWFYGGDEAERAYTVFFIGLGVIAFSVVLAPLILGGIFALLYKNPFLVFGFITPYIALFFWFALNSQFNNTKINNNIKKIPVYMKEHYKEDFKYAPINGTGSERFVKSNDTSFQIDLDLKGYRGESIKFDDIKEQIDKQYNENLEQRKGIENIRKYIEENGYKYKENKSKYYKNDWILEISEYYYSEKEKNKFINLEIRVFTDEKNINIVKKDVYNIFKKSDEKTDLNYNFKIGIYKKEAENTTENLWNYSIFSNTIERNLENFSLENNFGAPAIDTIEEFYLIESESEKSIYEIIRNSDKNFDNIGELNKLKDKKISFEFKNGKREPIQVAMDEYFSASDKDKTKPIRIVKFLINEGIDLDYINKNNKLSPATRIKKSGDENLMRVIDIRKYEDKKFDYLEYLKSRKK